MAGGRARARPCRLDRTRPLDLARSAAVDGPRDQRGESLVELLATISIVSICVVGLVAALGINYVFSSSNAVVDHAHEILSRYAEALVAEPYEACTAGAPYTSAAINDIPDSALPDGTTAGAPGSVDTTSSAYALSLQSVQYWNGDSAPATFSASCPATDSGYQQVVLLAQAGDGSYSETMTIYKRRP